MDNNHFNPGYNPYGQGAPQNLAPQHPGQQQQSGGQQQPQQHPQQQHHQHGQPPNIGSPYGGLSAQSHQASQQQQPSPSHTTLPPLQAQNGYPQFGSLSHTYANSQSQPSSAPHTPSSSSMTSTGPSGYGNNNGSMLPPSYPSNPYGHLSQSMMYPSSTATSMPPSSSTAGLPTIRPMPPGGASAPNSLPSLATAAQMGQVGQQASFMQNEEAPTHVVGSQGRRGILPSAPGRPNPPAQGSGQVAKSMIPTKDADGKFPCPHCNKTYLHAKHLKRHLLRHTGDRPYMCHLCKDTFSRSDILKRHFQKCSLRRGNPTGANHLAHQRRNTNTNKRLSMTQQDGPIGLANMPEVAGPSGYNTGVVGSSPSVNGDLSGRSSRANSIITPASIANRNNAAGLGILASNGANGEQMTTSAPYQSGMNAYAMQNGASGAPMPTSYPFNGQQQVNNAIYSNPNTPQQMSFLGHQSSRFDNSQANNHQPIPNGDGNGVDWTRMFTQGGQDGFIGSLSANASSQGISNLKTESSNHKTDYNAQNEVSNESFLGNLYSHSGGFGGEEIENGIPGFPNWSTEDPLQAKCDSLMLHCFPDGPDSVLGNSAAELMQMCLKPENVKHFAEHYTSFHGHWPILHMPTFKLTDANNNLVLAILCIGAVYSPKLAVHQVRQMMEFVKKTVQTRSSVYTRTLSGQVNGMGIQPLEVEELQALSMLQTLFLWHGEPSQREAARGEFTMLVRIAKAMGLFQTAPMGHYAFSMLHSLRNSQATQFQASNWNWQGWLEQEKRNRILYQVIMTDAAMVMFFNTHPQLDPMEVSLMLPADDAAWDAGTQYECANALGLNGEHAQAKNANGTRRPVQPTMQGAMCALLDNYATFQPNTTNVFSKFLLIHALIIRIVACQKATLLPEGQFQGFSAGFNTSTPATPLSQNDWLEQHGNGSLSAPNSGHGTPTDHYSPKMNATAAAHVEKKRLGQALEKWKRNWDHDMELQYPPQHYHQRRFGFSRDGVHFFYLGRSFLQSQQPADWQVPADARFKRVLALLKRIKGVVVGDNEKIGQDIGSVGDIDDSYGLDSLNLDMKLLFKPYNSHLDSPVAGVQTHNPA
ncbi:C2H2 transcription factor like protein [Zymoseptoria brevis]|uniref:C2H2 transcription factor like protein n=1 Tax=Zymoseptoria brevis TaxID=1047168 RepID=A0A0F4GF25_9PEZI|nr:C2H2 transcription factor like protein [Zymoseptoria brevis]